MATQLCVRAAEESMVGISGFEWEDEEEYWL